MTALTENWTAALAAYVESQGKTTARPEPDDIDARVDAMFERWDAVLATPAPNMAAVFTKMDMIKARYSDDSIGTPACDHNHIVADMRRITAAPPAPAPMTNFQMIETLNEAALCAQATLDAISGAGLLDHSPANRDDAENHGRAMWLLAMLRDKINADLRRVDATNEAKVAASKFAADREVRS